MKVCYIFRAPNIGAQSIEKTFRLVMQNADFEYISVCLPYARADFKSIIKNILFCRKLAKKERIDVFHITGATNYVALGLPSKKTVLSIHDLGVVFDNKGFKGMIAKWLWFKIPLKKCNSITANSQKTLIELKKCFPKCKKKISIIPPPIPNDYSKEKKEFNTLTPTILQIGTKERKNLLRVIEALQGVNCHLRIIGKLSSKQKEALLKNNITYSNSYDISDEQMKKEYKNADIVTFISTYEGFGIPVIESQAMGKAVITSNIEPMKSIVGDKGCKVDPYNIGEIKRTIVRIINDVKYRDKLIENGIVNSEPYKAKHIAQRYKAVYKNTLK